MKGRAYFVRTSIKIRGSYWILRAEALTQFKFAIGRQPLKERLHSTDIEGLGTSLNGDRGIGKNSLNGEMRLIWNF